MVENELIQLRDRVCKKYGDDIAQDTIVKVLQSDIRNKPYVEGIKLAMTTAHNIRCNLVRPRTIANQSRLVIRLENDSIEVDYEARIMLKRILATDDGRFVVEQILAGNTSGSSRVSDAKDRLRGKFLR